METLLVELCILKTVLPKENTITFMVCWIEKERLSVGRGWKNVGIIQEGRRQS
jgi:hypothetical protein